MWYTIGMSKWLVITLFLGIITFVVWFVSKPIDKSYTEVSTSPKISNVDKLFFLINNYRKQNNLPAFEKNEELCTIAEKRSKIELDYHKGFLEEYSSYPYKISENVTTGLDPYNAFIGWRRSPSHNAAMLSDWKYACVSCHTTCVTIFSNLN